MTIDDRTIFTIVAAMLRSMMVIYKKVSIGKTFSKIAYRKVYELTIADRNINNFSDAISGILATCK